MKIHFASRAKDLKAGGLTALLKAATLPGVISFAGGLPCPTTFPHQIIQKNIRYLFKDIGTSILQYGLSSGLPELKHELIKLQTMLDHNHYKLDNLLITAGSQEAMDLIGKILLNKGDHILLESPTYLGALQAFNLYEPKYLAAPSDKEGIIPEKIERILRQKKVKLIYLVPNFQNPSGQTLSLKRRQQIANLIKKYQVFLLEDDPYRLVRFEGKDLPSIASCCHQIPNKNYVLYTSSFSKILAPGLRLGWIFGHEKFIEKMVIAKEGSMLHTSTFAQWIAYYYLKNNHLANQLIKIRKTYLLKAQLMEKLLNKYLSKKCQFTHPQGGLFFWIKAAKKYDFTKLYSQAINKYKVAYVPGEYFYAPGLKVEKNTLRLNFSYPTYEQIKEGIGRLAQLFK